MVDRDAASIVASRVRSVAASFFRFRAWLAPPAVLCAWLTAFAAGAPREQLRAMGAGMTVTALFFVYEARAVRAPMSDRRLAVSLLLTLVALSFASFVTGAIASPMVTVLFAPTLTAFAAWGQKRVESIAILAVFLLMIAALFFARDLAPFGALPRVASVRLSALFALVTVALLWSSVAGLADAYGRAAGELDRLREESVARVIARSRELDAVGATVAHEIKNPLAAIKGIVQLMARDERPERDARRLSVIEEQIDRMELVLRDYLAFARPLDPLRVERVSLPSLVERVVAALEPRASRAKVSLQWEGPSLALRVDRAKIEAALINLALNAIEASREGEGVRIVWKNASNNTVSLDVSDRGVGMSAVTLASVGTPFFTTRQEGTGLGFVIARGAIEQHSGTLSVASSYGSGTTVTVTLPCDDAPLENEL